MMMLYTYTNLYSCTCMSTQCVTYLPLEMVVPLLSNDLSLSSAMDLNAIIYSGGDNKISTWSKLDFYSIPTFNKINVKATLHVVLTSNSRSRHRPCNGVAGEASNVYGVGVKESH